MYMLNMVIILIVMYCNVVTAIDKIPTYLLRFNRHFVDTTLLICCRAFALGLLHRGCSGRAFRAQIYRHDHKVHAILSSGNGEPTLSVSGRPEPFSCSITPRDKRVKELNIADTMAR